ncbi:MAG: hypothetical protein WBV94_07385 [Blastocatellia bacterium]
MKREERPTSIIRTLPTLNGDVSTGAKRYKKSLRWLEKGMIEQIYIALQSIPKTEVLHIYLLVNGQVDVRLNIAGYLPGDERECWDEKIRTPKYWAVCTGPVSRPSESIKMRGFQGFRYTEGLW